MASRFVVARTEFRSRLTEQQQRGVRVLAWLSIVAVLGVTLTGVWQFFAHEPDPGWYRHVPGGVVQSGSSTSEGVAEWHSIFGDAVAVTAMFGGAWFAYRVLFDIPWRAGAALLVAVFGLVGGSVIRFNVVKLRGRSYDEAGRGYAQLFGGDLEFVVTDRFELGPMAIRLWTIGHLLTVPILLAIIWFGLPSADETP